MYINVIVFSKDRPAQLDLLLRSMKKHVGDRVSPHVIYKTQYSYHRVMKDHKEYAEFIEQKEMYLFKETVIRAVKSSGDLVMFLCDDDVFIRGFDPDHYLVKGLKTDMSIATLSLRLGKKLSYCYAYNGAMPRPMFRGNTWKWKGRPGDYGYPMSLDGHIFRTYELLDLLEVLNFSDPNTLEGAMAQRPLNCPLMMSFDEPRLVGVPWNIVSETSRNRYLKTETAKSMAAKYERGFRISYKPFKNLKPKSCHTQAELVWEKSENEKGA